MRLFYRGFIALGLLALATAPGHARATQAKIDPETCAQLRLEEIKFRQSGIMDDISKGADWAKANLSPDRLREVQQYLQLDEQVQFGCRDAKLSPEAEKASEAAVRIELNSDADPLAPPPPAKSPAPGVNDPPKPGVAAKKKSAHKQAAPKKQRPEQDGQNQDQAQPQDASSKPVKSKVTKAAPPPPVIVEPEPRTSTATAAPAADPAPAAAVSSDPGPNTTSAPADPPLPAFGFGETVVMPHPAP